MLKWAKNVHLRVYLPRLYLLKKFFIKKIHLFIWLRQALAVAHGPSLHHADLAGSRPL